MRNENRSGEMSPYSGPPWVFDMLGMAPFWLGKAEELKRAARLVWQGVQYDFNEVRRVASKDYDPDRDAVPQPLPSVVGPFVLLAALAIENLLKGILVVKTPEYVKDGKLRQDVITDHNLLKLAEEADVDLNEDEKRFCELGTSAIKGWGRYPIPTNAAKMKSQITVKGTAGEVFERMFARLAGMISQKPFPGERTAVEDT